MKVTFTKGNVALTAVVAASLAMASGCSTEHKSSSTASNWTSSDYQETASTTQSSGQLTETGAQSSVIPLYKEDISVSKRTVDAGTVSVRKIVKTETVNQPVELRHEEIVIDRQPASASASAAPGEAFQEKDTVIHLTREEPVVEKRVSSSGQVVVKTRSASEQQNIQGQVRSEDVAVVKSGNAENVTIGQGIQQSGEAMGGAESPSGQSSGESKDQSSGQINSAGEYKSGQPRIGNQ